MSDEESGSTSQSQSLRSRGSHSWERKYRYRTLYNQLQTTFDDEAPVTEDVTHKIEKVLDEACQISEEAKNDHNNFVTSETLLRSKLICATSQVLLQCSNNISANECAYDRHELAENIKSNPSFWASICLPKQIPSYSFLYGTFAAGPPIEKQRKARKPIVKQKTLSQAQKPDVLQNIHDKNGNFEVVKNVRKVIKAEYKSNQHRPISYLHLVVNPESFTKTIENIYHVSVLVRDGEASIEIDDEKKLPMIKPVSAEEKNARNATGSEGDTQMIFSIDIEDWEKTISSLDITNAMIK